MPKSKNPKRSPFNPLILSQSQEFFPGDSAPGMAGYRETRLSDQGSRKEASHE